MIVTCWCGSKNFEIPEKRVKEGDTDSCGKKACDPTLEHYNWRALFRKQPCTSKVLHSGGRR